MEKEKIIREETFLEEVLNAVSHGIGVLLSIAALTILVVFGSKYGTAWHIVSYSIYGSTLILLYLASTLYHSIPKGNIKKIFKVLDHSAIFLLIAGCYTPITLLGLKGALGWTLFGIVWGIAILGIIFKVIFIEKFKILSTIMYLAMGWIIIFAIKPLVEILPTKGLIFLVAGGITYSIGAIFYSIKKLKFNHSIWHLFVIGGSVFHFFTMLNLI